MSLVKGENERLRGLQNILRIDISNERIREAMKRDDLEEVIGILQSYPDCLGYVSM